MFKGDIFDKFNDIFKNFDDNFKRFDTTTPEEFMKGEYTKTTEHGTDENGKYTLETFISKDGKRKFTRKIVNARTPKNYCENIHNKTSPKRAQGSRPEDSKNNNQLYTLEEELRRTIKDERFEKACALRDKIARIKSAVGK